MLPLSSKSDAAARECGATCGGAAAASRVDGRVGAEGGLRGLVAVVRGVGGGGQIFSAAVTSMSASLELSVIGG